MRGEVVQVELPRVDVEPDRRELAGVPVLQRNHRGARLTPLGLVFVAEAEEILVRLDQAERLVTTQRDLGMSTIRVGTFASIGSQLLPRAIGRLRAKM